MKSTKQILAIDIGGSGLKAALITPHKKMASERLRVKTPKAASPAFIVKTLIKLVDPLKTYHRVAVGFPGLVRDGVVFAAPNLGNKAWFKYPLAEELEKRLKKPVRILNDAEMQGLSVISGRGMELTVTLGTGFGIGIFLNGRPIPHLELSQHPVHKNLTYDQYLGDKARKKVGKKKWVKRLNHAIGVLKIVVNYDRLYVGGGNAKKIDQPLKHRAKVVPNVAGLLGGAMLWKYERK